MKNRFTPILILASALWMFGLSAQAQTQTGPKIGGSVYGGGKGSSAIVTGDVLVEVQSGTVGTLNGDALTDGTGDVYGGGALANVDGGTKVDLKGGTVLGDLYGGGALAHVNVTSQGGHTQGANAEVTVSGGTVRTVYGGGMGQSTPSAVAALVYGNTSVTIVGGTINGKQISTGINGGVFGGCNERGTVLGGATVTINSPVGQSNNHLNVYGGGLGANTNVQGSVAVEIKEDDDITPAIFGDVYGGSAKGLVNYAYNNNNTPTTPNDGENIATTVTLTDGMVTGDIYGGGHGLDGASANVGREVTVTIEGGSVATYGTDNVNGGNVFGCNNAAGSPLDTVNVHVTGGALRNVFGGGNLASKTGKGVAVTYNATPSNSEIDTIFGGGNKAGVVGNVKVIMVDGTVNKGIYGGCNASGNIGGKITVNVEGGTIGAQSYLVLPTPVVANVFGGGYGENTSASGNVEVNIGTGTTGPDIYGDVYGGSALGSVNSLETNTTKVNILNGTLHSVIDPTSGFKVYHGGNVYGGGLGQNGTGNEAKGQVNGEIIVNVGAAAGATTGEEALEEHSGNATIGGNVYGCNNTSGSPQQDVTVNIFGTAHTTGANGNAVDGVGFAIANVFGGGNEANYAPTVSGKKASVNVFGCKNTVERVFGGGNAAATPSVGTDIQGGRFSEVYGGGNGERGTDFAADINGNVSLVIHGGDVGMFFVGSNQNGTITGFSSVSIDDEGPCEETQIEEFFCGGNYADFVGNIDATIECSNSLNVRNLYGGCNQADVVDNPATTEVEGNIHLKVYGGHFENVYGGSKGTEAVGANISGNVQLDIFGGVIDTIFGGSNINGNVYGKIVVNIMNNEACGFDVHNVYGGGRNAAYRPDVEGDYPEVNIIHGRISKKVVGSVKTGGIVFGGGYGESAVVASNPKVRVGYDATMAGYIPTDYGITETNRHAVVDSLVFGGGDQAPVAGSTNVTIQKSNSSANRLFGGGNNANVGNATVNVDNGNVTGGVYGGCNTSGTVGGIIDDQPYDGTILVNLNGGKVGTDNSHRADVYGGGFGGGSNGTFTNGNITVTLQDAAEVFGDLYGGSAFGSVNAANSKTTVNVSNNKLHGQVFGGGKGQLEGANQVAYTATTNGNVEVNILAANTNGNLTGIYGGANVKGNIVGDINVNVTANVGASGTNNSRDIFGGGLGANTTTNGNVTVKIGEGTTPDVYGDIYGGSALGQVGASDKLTKVDFLNGTLNGTLYGGGMGQIGNNPVAAEVTGNVQVAVGNGSISGGVYGGCNLKGSVKGDIQVYIAKGTIGTSTSARANVHGGGLGAATTTEGDVTVNIASNNATEGPTIYGDLYGGSGFGQVSASNKLTKVNFYKGTINGDVYGGGLGDANNPAEVSGNVEVNIHGGVFKSSTGAAGGGQVFGCNNAKGTPKGKVEVNIYSTDHGTGVANNECPAVGTITTAAQLETNASSQTYAIAAVYGGGNEASYEPVADKSTTVHVYNCNNTIKDVFGGGNAANVGTLDANPDETGNQTIPTNTFIIIDGGRIDRVFGGGNGQVRDANIYGTATTRIYAGLIGKIFGGGNVNGTITNTSLNLYKDDDCTDEVFGEVFGGANEAPIAGTLNTTINCGVGTIGEIYGGSNLAQIGTAGSTDATVNLTINGGDYQYVFGGSKGSSTSGANINGNVNLYLHGGTIANAFGGSNVKGNITGKITVDVLDNEGTCPLQLTNVYGGGKDASYQPNTSTLLSPEVNIKHIKQGNSVTNVYGGGFGATAEVKAYPQVTIGDEVENHYAVVSGNVYGGGEEAPVTGNPTIVMMNANSQVKKLFGGGAEAGVTGSTSITLSDGLVADGIFGGCDITGTITGNTEVNLNGGNVGNDENPAHYGVCGGGYGQPTRVGGNVTVTLDGSSLNSDIYGGSFYGDVNTNATNTTTVTLNSGSVTGNVYGGALGDRETNVEAKVNGKVFVNIHGGQVSGDVFGCNNDNGAPQSDVTVTMDGGQVRSVLGGGNMAAYAGTPVITISGGVVLSQVVGGGNAADVNGSSITISGGNIATSNIVNRGVYGGCNEREDVLGNVSITITGGTIGSSTNPSNVFGGGYGKETRVSDNIVVLINGAGAIVWGDVYGGSALGNVNGNNSDPTKHTNVTLNGGTVKGNLYGGGLGNSGATGVPDDPDTPVDESLDMNMQAAAKVNGAVAVSIGGGRVEGSVYGCNNVYGAPQNNVKVDVYSSDFISNVFGGGNLSGFGGTPEVTIHNCNNTIGYVYGGGNKASVVGTNVKVYGGTIGEVYGGGNGEGLAATEVMVSGNAAAYIYGGTIGKVFAGNNSNGMIAGTITLNIDKTAEGEDEACPMKVVEVYGGGNQAAGKAGTITIGCTGTLVALGEGQHYGVDQEGIRYVYGGANKADIGTASTPSNITLNINSGIVENVFGGNNTSGTIYGDITVNIEKTGECGWYVGNVYGGGNMAPYGRTPDVNIIAGTVSGNVFGGGNQAGVAGGDVAMTGGTVLGGIYGGCDSEGIVDGNIVVEVTGGTIGTSTTQRADIYGGGYGPETGTSGNVTVNFGAESSTHNEYPMLYGDLYGGSAFGSVNNSSSNTTVVNVLNGTLVSDKRQGEGTTVNGQTYYVYTGGNVFGGGLGEAGNDNKGKVNGVVSVNIGAPSRDLNPEEDSNKGMAVVQGNIYGCNNTGGSPQDNVTVNIYRTYRTDSDQITYEPTSANPATFALANVFGGGNKADYKPVVADKRLEVLIHGCYNSIERVFGGSNAAAAGTSAYPVVVKTDIEGGRFGTVFGGGNGEIDPANINGNVDLGIHGGIVDEFYVGSNEQGSISGTSNVTVDQSSGCEQVLITEFYCGGKYADFIGDIDATITCSQEMHVTNLYGGCKEAHVKAGNGGSGNIHLVVKGGTFENVYGGSKGTPTKGADIQGNVLLEIFGGTVTNAIYGGSNVKGAIGGSITVNVEQKTGEEYCDLDVSLADVYGGGNQADYPGEPASDSPITGNNTHTSPYNYPEVNIKNATVKNVFGGGFKAKVTGNPQIQLKNKATILGNVYGGGNMGEVKGDPKVILNGKQLN